MNLCWSFRFQSLAMIAKFWTGDGTVTCPITSKTNFSRELWVPISNLNHWKFCKWIVNCNRRVKSQFSEHFKHQLHVKFIHGNSKSTRQFSLHKIITVRWCCYSCLENIYSKYSGAGWILKFAFIVHLLPYITSRVGTSCCA